MLSDNLDAIVSSKERAVGSGRLEEAIRCDEQDVILRERRRGATGHDQFVEHSQWGRVAFECRDFARSVDDTGGMRGRSIGKSPLGRIERTQKEREKAAGGNIIPQQTVEERGNLADVRVRAA